MPLDDEREGDELLARHEPKVVDQKLHQLLNNSQDRSLLSFLFGAHNSPICNAGFFCAILWRLIEALASEGLIFFLKMGLEFFSAGLEFF